ncbi:MAG: RNA-binding protein [Hyphomicrobium sp.]
MGETADDGSTPGRDPRLREPAGPTRLCASTRTERPLDELIRFVAGPDGAIVVDLAGKLPGRGVWLTCDRRIVSAAVKSNPFARSLKRSVRVDPDLAEAVDRGLLTRVQGALSIANKSGLISSGFTQIDGQLAAGGVWLLVHGSDAAEGGRDKLDRKFTASCRELGREALILSPLTIEQMSLAMGRANVVHAALKQGGAAEKFLSEAGRLMRYRSGSVLPDIDCATPRNQV